jgi:hypothetical protein
VFGSGEQLYFMSSKQFERNSLEVGGWVILATTRTTRPAVWVSHSFPLKRYVVIASEIKQPKRFINL